MKEQITKILLTLAIGFYFSMGIRAGDKIFELTHNESFFTLLLNSVLIQLLTRAG